MPKNDIMETALAKMTGVTMGHSHAATLLFVALKDGLSLDHVHRGLSRSISNADFFVKQGIEQSPGDSEMIDHLIPSIREGFISALNQQISALNQS